MSHGNCIVSRPSNSDLLLPTMAHCQQRRRRNRTQTKNGCSNDDIVVQHSLNYFSIENAVIPGTNIISTEWTNKRRKRHILTQRGVSLSAYWTVMMIALFSLQSTIAVVDGSAPPNQPHQSRQFPFWRRRRTTTSSTATTAKDDERGWKTSSLNISDTKQASIFRRKKQNQKNNLDGRTRERSTEEKGDDDDNDTMDLQKFTNPLSIYENDYDTDCPPSLSIAITPVAYIRGLSRRLTTHRPRWLRLPPPEIFEEWVSVARDFAMGTIIVFIAFQIIIVVRDVVREVLNEMDFMDQETGIFPTPSFMGSSSQSVVSPKDARKIVTWLDDGGRNENTIPPNVPSWVIHVAQNLYSYRNLPSRELERILCEITRTEASLLEECLLRPDSHDDTFEAVGGLFGAKTAIRQWISTFNLPPPSVHSRMDGSRATATTSKEACLQTTIRGKRQSQTDQQ